MPIGSTLIYPVLHNEYQKVVPYSMTGGWVDAIQATGFNAIDAANVTNVITQVTRATTIPVRRAGQGTMAIFSLAYDRLFSAISTTPQIRVFGRTGNGPWIPLFLRNTDTDTLDLVPNLTTNADDGTLKYTTPSYNTGAFDCRGTDEIVAALQRTIAGTGGNVALTRLLMQII